MFGNLIRECGVLDSLSECAQKVPANLITIFLGIIIASTYAIGSITDAMARRTESNGTDKDANG